MRNNVGYPILMISEALTITVFSTSKAKRKTLTQRRFDVEALAKSFRARAASNSRVLVYIAGCQILNFI